MDSLMMNQQAKRFLGITLILHPINRIISDKIGYIPVTTHRIVILRDEIRIIIISLSGHNLPIIKSAGQALQMPFADQCRLIAYLLQKLRKSLLGAVEHTSRIIIKLIRATMFARYHTGTARTAQGIRDKTLGKADTVGSDTVKIRSFHITSIITTHHLSGMIVRHYIDNIILSDILFFGLTCRR